MISIKAPTARNRFQGSIICHEREFQMPQDAMFVSVLVVAAFTLFGLVLAWAHAKAH